MVYCYSDNGSCRTYLSGLVISCCVPVCLGCFRFR
uniref:Bm13392 n=2 Tax=Brugia malayi TaxID=6279 RepID=A0A0J9Y9P4_BRUMA|nr:Bm13392 [Brugia malayi]